jgi:hypothetical protein
MMPKLRHADAPPRFRKTPRNQAQIAKEWWSKKQKTNQDLVEEKHSLMAEMEKLRSERLRLELEVHALRETNAKCKEANTGLMVSLEDAIDTNLTLSSSLSEMRGRNDELMSSQVEQQDANATLTSLLEDMQQAKLKCNSIFAGLQELGGLTKLNDKATRVAAIGVTIISLLSVLMKSTHPITRLRTVCDAIFEKAIFGASVTKLVLQEIYKKYIYKEHRSLFAPWKILRAIDLS